MTTIQKLIAAYLNELGTAGRPMPLRTFADLLSQPIAGLRWSFSYQSIKNWIDGTHRPDETKIYALTVFSPIGSTPWKFAHDMRAAMYPSVHRPVSEIGRRVLDESSVAEAAEK